MEKEFAFTDSDFAFLQEIVKSMTGIILKPFKREMIYGRVARRVRATGLKSVEEYCNFIRSPENESELMHFVNAVTTNLTRFFREEHHFEHLAKQVLQPLSKNTSGEFRVWSAGCSSGMEAYSIAMTILDNMPNANRLDIKILATDIDTNMLTTGAQGEYDASSAKEIPERLFKKYLITKSGSDNKVQMKPELRKMVYFKSLNLLQEWPMSKKFDVIFCRNVVIYFDKPTQKILFDRFANVMKPDGWLYIGHSENLHNVTTRFDLHGRTIYQYNAKAIA